jgi:hypothetical protein
MLIVTPVNIVITDVNHIPLKVDYLYVILRVMTKETHEPSLDGIMNDKNSTRPTIFSDGSTFDYVNGYQSNGAPVATRDRTDLPTIAKTGALMSINTLANLIILALTLLVVAAFTAFGLSTYHAQANEKAIIENINLTGQAVVIGNDIQSTESGDILVVRDQSDNNIYKCEVVTVLDPTAKALIFCNPGPVNFSIPVPYDPSNIFYTTPPQNG